MTTRLSEAHAYGGRLREQWPLDLKKVGGCGMRLLQILEFVSEAGENRGENVLLLLRILAFLKRRSFRVRGSCEPRLLWKLDISLLTSPKHSLFTGWRSRFLKKW